MTDLELQRVIEILKKGFASESFNEHGEFYNFHFCFTVSDKDIEDVLLLEKVLGCKVASLFFEFFKNDA